MAALSQVVVIDFSINNMNDFDRVLNTNQSIRARVLDTILKRNEFNVDIVPVFDTMKPLLGSLDAGTLQGSSISAEVMDLKDIYTKFLEKSFKTCNSIFPQCLIALKCHQLALQYLENGQNDLVTEMMDHAEEITGKIALKYEELIRDATVLEEKGMKVFISANEDNVGLCEKIRKGVPHDGSVEKSDELIKSLGKIQNAFSNIRLSWLQAKVSVEFLAPSNVGHMVELKDLAEEVIVDSGFKWMALAKESQRVIDGILKQSVPAIKDKQSEEDCKEMAV